VTAAPPRPLMTVMIAPKPGARPREVIVDAAGCDEILRAVTVAAEGLRHAQFAVDMLLRPAPAAERIARDPGTDPVTVLAPADEFVQCPAMHGGPFAVMGMCELDAGHDGDHGLTTDDGVEVTWPATPPEAAEADVLLCGARPYPAGSDGDDGTECMLPEGHDGAPDEAEALGAGEPTAEWAAVASSILEGTPDEAAPGSCGRRVMPLDRGTSRCTLPAGHDPAPNCPGTLPQDARERDDDTSAGELAVDEILDARDREPRSDSFMGPGVYDNPDDGRAAPTLLPGFAVPTDWERGNVRPIRSAAYLELAAETLADATGITP